VLALTVLAAATMGVLWNAARSGERDRVSLRAAGAHFAQAFLTLDSAHIDRTEAAVVALSTGAFQRTYKQGLEAGVLRTILSVAHATTTAKPAEVFVGTFDGRSASVIAHETVTVVAFDSAGHARAPRSVEFYIQLDLVKQSGRWLVDGVENLNFGAAPAATQTPAKR
jgi:hypothetical protein